MASSGIVKILDERTGCSADARTYPDTPWEPKESFHALASRHKAL